MAIASATESRPAQAGWERIDPAHRTRLKDAIGTVRDALGPNLRSATVYGEVVTGGFDLRRHTVHSILVVDKVDLPSLRRLAGLGLRLAKAYLSAPVVATVPYIQDSLDTFPLEWLEIQQQGVTVFGPDHFSGLVLESECIRHQCECEIKTLLMGLRSALLAATGREKAVALIEHEASDRFMRALRGMLWLRGSRGFLPATAVMDEIEKIVGARLDGLRSSLDPTARHDWNEFDRLYGEVELLMGKADAI